MTHKLKKYTVWTHYDTGIQQEVLAEDEDDALEKAEEIIEGGSKSKEFDRQILDNLQAGESDVASR